MKTRLPGLLIAFALLVGGCGNAAQKEAYEHAVAMEQQLSGDHASEVVAEYRKVIRLEPGAKGATTHRGGGGPAEGRGDT
jgi:hypothetical protein